MDKKCSYCEKHFNGRENQKFCSKSCAVSFRNKNSKHKDVEVICLTCGKKIFVQYNERNRKFCSRICYSNYYKGRKSKPFTEEHKKNISKAKKGISTGSRLTPANINFWIHKGFSELEAKKRVFENQKNASIKSNEKRKGKTFDDIYGKERAIIIKNKISNKLVINYSVLTIQEKEALKIKNSESVLAFWNSGSFYSNNLKDKFSKQRSEYNKVKQSSFLLNLSEERKQEIKIKKQETWNNHSEEEKFEITIKRVTNSQKSMRKNTWGKKIIIENKEYIVNSSFEEKFILKCFELKIPIKRGPIIKYVWDGKIRYYFVDFEINKNKKKYLIELKGTHKWYYEELNNGKLFAKNQAVLAYINKSNYEEFIFILNNTEQYEKILKEI